MIAVPIEINWNPDLPIYASGGFLKSVSDEFGWLGGKDNSGNVLCILPYTIIRKALVRMVRFRVETISVGDGLSIEEEKLFLNSAIGYFRSIDADIIIPATTNTIFRTYPQGAIAAPYGTFKIDLNQPEKDLWDNLHSKHRNVIRKAIKEGIQIFNDSRYLDKAYNLIKDTFRRSAIAYMSWDAFRSMIEGLGKYVRVFIADYRGIIQGCAIIPFSNHAAYYVYGGSIPRPIAGATNLIQWEAIRHFHGLGVKQYDFCGVRINPENGSKQAGLKMFKERFGPRLVQGYLWKFHLNPIKSAAYSLGVRLLRGGDIVDAERHKLKSL
jgi:hypothetical protein